MTSLHHHAIPALLAATLLTVSGCLGFGAPVDAPEDMAPAAFDLSAFGDPFPPGNYQFDAYARVLADGPFGELPLVKTLLDSPVDGADIEIGLWRPDVPEGTLVPVLVDAGPYYGNDGAPMENRGGHLGRMLENFVSHGYAVAGISVRGTGQSGGCMDLMGPSEVADLDAAITWLATQPWSNGRVGMVGKSYDGSTPWMVASTGNPHLKTIVPISGVPDVYELMFRNGTSEIRGSVLLNALYYSYAARTSPYADSPDDAQRLAVNTAEGLACPDHAVGLAAALHAGATGARDPTGYWDARNLKRGVEANYAGSILMVQGLQDWNVDPGLSIPWVDQLNASGLFVHQILGQWGHSHPDDSDSPPTNPNMRWDWAEILLRWFDHWLKDGSDAPLGPPVQILDDERRWRADTSFPPRDATWTTYHLSAGDALAPEAGAHGSVRLVPQAVGHPLRGEVVDGVAIPRLDPPATPGRSADFWLPAQETDLRISGLPRVHVSVTPDGPGGFLAAHLYDVDEEGNQDPVGWTMMNLRFHEGGYEAHDVAPGETIVAKMEIQPMEATIEAGHSLLLRVWQYRDDAGGDTAQGRHPNHVPGPVTIHYGGDFTSVLELPTIERGPEHFFQPPYPAEDA